MLTVSLSWPPVPLWPNAKAHPKAKSPFTRRARDEAYVATKAALNGEPWSDPGGVIDVYVTGHKPAEHGQDRDGFSAALKPTYDGIALALGINDKRLRHNVDWGESIPGGGVTVEVSP